MKQIIGEGLYGEVNLCVHKSTGQMRAVEIIHKMKMTVEQ